MGRKRKKAETEMGEKAAEIRQQAKILADESGDAVRDFASTTGSAARDFAHTAYSAAKELLETVEKAGDRLDKETKPPRRRGRKILKLGAAIGVGAFLFTNDSVRNAIRDKLGFGAGQPEPWEAPASTPSDGEFSQPVSQTAT